MKKFKAAAVVLSLVMAFGWASGCSKGNSSGSAASTASGSSQEVVIKYPTFQVGVNSSAPVLKKAVDQFNEKNKGKIKVQTESIAGDDNYVNKIKVLLSANQLPDIVYAGGYNLLDMCLAKNAVVDLTPYMKADSAWKDSFDTRTLDFNSRNGKIYAAPDETQVIGYFYNKDLFKKAGIASPAKTWDEFFTDCDKLKASGVAPLSMDTQDSAWITSLLTGAIVGTGSSSGAQFMDKMNPTKYDTPDFAFAVKKTQLMLQKYTTSDAIGGKYENGANNFYSGKTAMLANGSWEISNFSDTTKAPADFAKKVGVAIYPNNGVYNAPMIGYFVCAKDKAHQDAAVQVVKYFTSQEVQSMALDTVGRVPSSPKVQITDSVKQKYPLLSELLEAKNSAKYQFCNLQATMYPSVLQKYQDDLPMLASGKLTAEQFCTDLTNAAGSSSK
jgi:raffinose/stachyose/melibiose transport system substrate-binding protein